jgi:4-hydroxy-tetrahydrodipicolinate synthase
MLYNNPLAYRTDVTATQVAELADIHDNLHGMKESSGDVRRVTAVVKCWAIDWRFSPAWTT